MPRHEPRSMTWLEARSIPEPNSGCWLWLGATHRNGYGHAKVERSRRSTGAHRMAYEIARGSIPEGMDVCHKCDTRCCVNPAHLFIGTRKENLRDCIAKGRNSRGIKHALLHAGERSPHAKLTWPQVRKIRADAANGADKAALAEANGVCVENIKQILAFRSWKHDPQLIGEAA